MDHQLELIKLAEDIWYPYSDRYIYDDANYDEKESGENEYEPDMSASYAWDKWEYANEVMYDNWDKITERDHYRGRVKCFVLALMALVDKSDIDNPEMWGYDVVAMATNDEQRDDRHTICMTAPTKFSIDGVNIILNAIKHTKNSNITNLSIDGRYTTDVDKLAMLKSIYDALLVNGHIKVVKLENMTLTPSEIEVANSISALKTVTQLDIEH
jgi:hypothetical protein